MQLSESDWFKVFNGEIQIINGQLVDKDELAKYINSMSSAMFIVLRSLKVPDQVIEGITKADQKLITNYLWTVQSNSDFTGEEKARMANIILWAANTINICSCCGMFFVNDAVSQGELPAVGKQKPKDLN
jgi:hypothetical protein